MVVQDCWTFEANMLACSHRLSHSECSSPLWAGGRRHWGRENSRRRLRRCVVPKNESSQGILRGFEYRYMGGLQSPTFCFNPRAVFKAGRNICDADKSFEVVSK